MKPTMAGVSGQTTFVLKLNYIRRSRGLPSCRMKNKIHPQGIQAKVNVSEKVVHNPNAHLHSDNHYPSAYHLLSIIKFGSIGYGKDAIGAEVILSEGTALWPTDV